MNRVNQKSILNLIQDKNQKLRALIVALCVFAFVAGNLQAQSTVSRNGLFSAKLVQDGNVLSSKQSMAVMAAQNDALKQYYSNGRTLIVLGNVTWVTGAVLLGCSPIFMTETEDDVNIGGATAAAISGGVGLIGGMIVLLLGVDKVNTAIKIYNSNLQGQSVSMNVDFGITPSGGIGFTMRF